MEGGLCSFLLREERNEIKKKLNTEKEKKIT